MPLAHARVRLGSDFSGPTTIAWMHDTGQVPLGAMEGGEEFSKR